MKTLILPIVFLMLTGCGKDIQQKERSFASASGSGSIEPALEVALETGFDQEGQFSFDLYKNIAGDKCFEIPESITRISGEQDSLSTIRLDINKLESGDVDIYCKYELKEDHFGIENCYDYADRPLRVYESWFSDKDTSIEFKFQNTTTTSERKAQVTLYLKTCGADK